MKQTTYQQWLKALGE